MPMPRLKDSSHKSWTQNLVLENPQNLGPATVTVSYKAFAVFFSIVADLQHIQCHNYIIYRLR